MAKTLIVWQILVPRTVIRVVGFPASSDSFLFDPVVLLLKKISLPPCVVVVLMTHSFLCSPLVPDNLLVGDLMFLMVRACVRACVCRHTQTYISVITLLLQLFWIFLQVIWFILWFCFHIQRSKATTSDNNTPSAFYGWRVKMIVNRLYTGQ